MIDLTYVLGTFPLARETFVTGEIAAAAGMVERCRVVALRRSNEPDLRPGDIPATVSIDWFPTWREPAWSASAIRDCPAIVRSVTGAVLSRSDSSLRSSLQDVYRHTRVDAWLRSRGRGVPTLPAAGAHLHTHFATRAAMAARDTAIKLGRPYSVTVHAYDLYMDNPYLEPVVRDASLIVAISEHGRQELLRRVPEVADRVRVIHVGVPTDRLVPLPSSALEPRTGRPARIVSVGRLVPKKGFAALIEAMAILRGRGVDATLEIIGDGPLRDELDADISRRGLGSTIRLAGGLPPDGARDRIAHADVFALACTVGPDGDTDGIPVVLMEAMAVGVPVVSTPVAGIPELIGHGRTGRLARVDDPASLADELAATLALDEGPRSAQVRAARSYVEGAFDQRGNAASLVSAIRAVSPGPTRSSVLDTPRSATSPAP